jgi:hypothetical protein
MYAILAFLVLIDTLYTLGSHIIQGYITAKTPGITHMAYKDLFRRQTKDVSRSFSELTGTYQK